MKVYEFKFEDLEQEEFMHEKNSNIKNILDSNVKVDVLIGKAKKTVKEIINLSEGDFIPLDKNVDGKLDICIGNNKVAIGESVILENKIAIRVSDAECDN